MYASSGTRNRSATLQAGETIAVNVGLSYNNSRQGQGSAVHIVSDKLVSAVQIADGDGYDQTSFFPTGMLNKHFGISRNTQYVAVACTEDDTSVTLYRPNRDPETQSCSADGQYPGKLFFGTASNNGMDIPAGSFIESSHKIYVIYENAQSEDEHNLLGTPSDTPFFRSDMEGNSPASLWSDVRREERDGGASINFVNDGISQVAQFNYQAGRQNSVWLRKNFGDYRSVGEAPVDELWVNFEYEVSDTAVYNQNQNRSNKILLVNWSDPETARRTYQVQLGAYRNGDGHVLRLEQGIFTRSTGRWERGRMLGQPASAAIPENDKLYLQLHIRNSTDGRANGLVELYSNGELIVQQSDVSLNDTFDDNPNHIILTPYISDGNGQANGYSRYDNVSVYDLNPGRFRAPR
jgi:hypothetical protein